MYINNILDLLRKRLKDDRENKIIFTRALIHLARYCLFSSYRKKRCKEPIFQLMKKQNYAIFSKQVNTVFFKDLYIKD
jgi:hypothetical protein